MKHKITLTHAELSLLLQAGEGQRLEFKADVSASFAKELVAFANAEGGRIIVGVSDKNHVVGVDVSNRLISRIQDIARNCDPSINVSCRTISLESKKVLIVDIPEGNKNPYSCSEGYFLRVGANSQKMRRDELLEFVRKVQPYCFDEQPCLSFRYPRDFDAEAFRLFLAKAEIDSSHLKTIDILRNLGVAELSKDNGPVFNNAGVLFFARDSSRFIRQAKITCLLLGGTDKADILDRKDLAGNLAENVQQALVFLKRHLSVRYKIESLKREEILELPESALREAVLNAVTHRDYAERGAVAMVEIYRDRVEISNPGGLPPGIKRSELGRRSVHRNPLIADLFHRLGEVEKVGSGIRRIREAAATAHVPAPKFEINGFFAVTFRKAGVRELPKETRGRPKFVPSLSQDTHVTGQVPDKYRTSTGQVLEYCKDPRKASEIQKYLGLKHRETFQDNYLKPLLRDGLIAMTIPEKPRSSKQRYVLTKKGIKALRS